MILQADTQAQRVVEKFASLGVACSLERTVDGPTIRRVELRPGPRTRMLDYRRLGRADDLACALEVPRVRVLTPIPGTNLVGVEFPRRDRHVVSLAELPRAEWPRVPIGVDLDGSPVALDFDAAPHFLVAGTTGSGKSSFLHAILCSLLRSMSPAELRLILVDVKRVELTRYAGLPHLAGPVAADAETAIRQLRGTVANVDKRLKLLETLGARNWSEGNAALERMGRDPLPFVLVVVDELAELMMQSRREVETLVVRLAQRARAAGIHLVLATQYPTANVVSGLIRVNVPGKVAFSVPDQVASRVILDRGGAEQLLGAGDGLLSFGGEEPIRFQGAFVGPAECEALRP